MKRWLTSGLGGKAGGPTRREMLTGLVGGVFWPAGAQAATGRTGAQDPEPVIRYGWDEGFVAPTEATLHVAPWGDDEAPGSADRPLRSIQRGIDVLAALPGGSLAIRAGIYRELVRLDALRAPSGAFYHIHRYGQDRVQISAAEVLDGWQPCSAAEAAGLGIAPEGVFVTRLAASRLQHGAPLALNLHAAGRWCSIATDRADVSDPERSGDPASFHRGDFLLDDEDRILALRDPRLVGLSATHLQEVRVLVYHQPNFVSPIAIAGFDSATGTITLADTGLRVQRQGKVAVALYALQNIATALRPQSWIVREAPDGMLAIYFHPADPLDLAGRIEVSLRPTCIDLGSASGIELSGLEVVRAAGEALLDGICIRRGQEGDGSRQDLRIVNCRVGENLSTSERGYAALYVHGALGVTIQQTTIGPARNSFGLFLMDCQESDLRFLHITGVSNSPARFYTLRNAVLAFSLFEDSGFDAHANKLNFYEGCDTVLVYGLRCRRTGGYATYQEASRIHFGFCEFDCAPGSQNRALVSQNRAPGADQGGADGSGDPIAGSTFYYWNNSLLADPRHPDPANSLVLGPAGSSQAHAVYNNILHGGGFDAIYLEGADPSHELRSHNRYTGLSWWQEMRYGWRLRPSEEVMRIGTRPKGTGLDIRPVIIAAIMPLFPGFTNWSTDIDGNAIDWATAPIGCLAVR